MSALRAALLFVAVACGCSLVTNLDDLRACDACTDASAEASGDVGVDAPADASAPLALDPGFPVTDKAGNAPAKTLVTASFDVAADRLLVAVVVWGQWGGAGVWPVTVTGGGVTWTSRVQYVSSPSYPDAVGVSISTAYASAALTGVQVTATRSNTANADGVLAVYAFAGASQSPGATGGEEVFDGGNVPLSVTLDAHGGGFVVFGMLDGNGAAGLRGNPLPNTKYDVTLTSGSGNTAAVGRLIGTSTPGTVTVGQDSNFDHIATAGLEVVPQ